MTASAKPGFAHSKETYIAGFTLVAIILHLVLRHALHFPFLTSNLPLFAALLAGAPLLWELLNKLVKREFGSDLLAGISILTAVILGQYLVAAIVVLMLSGGAALEGYATARASSVLEALAQRMPSVAHRKEAGGLADVKLADIRIGDELTVLPHEICPVDGIVMEGHGVMDEAYLTGEPYEMSKTPGSMVISGAINGEKALVIRAGKLAEDSRYARIMKVMHDTQQERPKLRRLGDQLGAWYTPIALGVAAAAAVLSGQAERFLSVVVIATPCPLLLAIPTAIIGAISLAARRAIIIKNPAVLEQIEKCQTLIFDKTGTLTIGKPEVAASWSSIPQGAGLSGSTLKRELQQEHAVPEAGVPIVQIAAALARNSTHPISQAIAKLSAQEVDLKEWQEIRGAGVQAKAKMEDGGWKMVRLGSLRWLKESGVDLAAGEKFIVEWSQQGATIVGLAVEQSLCGLFAVKDTVKPGAHAVVEQLLRQNLKTFLVTGDNTLTAAGIARQAGIAAENVAAEMRPEQKAGFVKKLQAQGERVAFVGDGINDAPALEQADLGIAVSRASDLAREAADIILLKSEIETVPEALGLARATLRTIKQNLFWAFFYNALGVPLAALGFISPILCAAAMGVSDLIVIGNALRLLRWR